MSDFKLKEQRVSGRDIYNGRIFDVKADEVLLENGKIAFRDYIIHSGGVCVVPLTDNGEVLMVRQFRYALGKVLLEVPAGKKNAEEDPLECGKRELLEETGYRGGEFISLGTMAPTPAYCTELIYMYLAKNLKFEKQNLDEDEFLEVVSYPLDELVGMVMRGEIVDAKTQIALLKTANLLNGR